MYVLRTALGRIAARSDRGRSLSLAYEAESSGRHRRTEGHADGHRRQAQENASPTLPLSTEVPGRGSPSWAARCLRARPRRFCRARSQTKPDKPAKAISSRPSRRSDLRDPAEHPHVVANVSSVRQRAAARGPTGRAARAAAFICSSKPERPARGHEALVQALISRGLRRVDTRQPEMPPGAKRTREGGNVNNSRRE